MSDTPRTDKEIKPWNNTLSGERTVPASFASQLERELNQAVEAVELLKELTDYYQDTHEEPMWERARAFLKNKIS